MRRWEFVGEGSEKFWEAAAEGDSVTVRFGKVGAAGQRQEKQFDSAEAALRHFAKAVADKERKGYREVAATAVTATTATEAAVAEAAVAEAAVAEAAVAPALTRPDESTFALPAAWRRAVHPRRGGFGGSVAAAAADAGAAVEKRIQEESAWVEQVLGAPQSDPQLVAVTRNQLADTTSPLGAAVLSALTRHYQFPEALYVDAWVEREGLPFAACAVAEYVGITAHWRQRGSQRSDESIRFRAPEEGIEQHWPRGLADRVRALLSRTDDATYRATVAALDAHRSGARGRIVVSFLLPAEQHWVDECLADPAARDTSNPVLRGMLLCSLGAPGQFAQLDGKFDLGWNGWSLPLVATVAEGIGTACVPLVEQAIEHAYGADRLKSFAGMAVEFPTDEAFGLLLGRLDDKHVRPQLLEACRRYPVRALRLVGAAAVGSAKNALMARQLLTAHVQAHRELALAVLPELGAGVAELVRSLAEETDRVADAPAEALPPLLVSPPWTRRSAPRKPRVLEGLVAVDEPQLRWQEGEQQRWARTDPWYWNYPESTDWVKEAEEKFTGDRDWGSYQQSRLLAQGPVEILAPYLVNWSPSDHWNGDEVYRPIVARYGLAALPVTLQAAAAQPAHLSKLLLPFLDLHAARLLADGLVRLKSVAPVARAWLDRHALDAVRLLVPDAVGKAGRARRGAEQALRTVAGTLGTAAVLDATTAGYGAEAAGIVAESLAADPLENVLPARMPTVPAWAAPAILPQLLLLDGAGALPAEATRHALTLLALSRPGEVYAGLSALTDACTGDSLAEFAWALFEEWRLAGMPPKESWALHALGWLGNDGTVRRLTPVLRAWPGEGAHHRAVEGLDVLAGIGSDIALLHLHGIAQRVKFKALKTRAQEKIAEVASGLGLTGEQLSDRLVPDLDLDLDGTTVIDYGPRRFTVGFDEQLRPYVLDADGKRRKDLPAVGVKDDPELAPGEKKRFATLKKDVRTIAADQIQRLEAAMVAQRSWSVSEFQELFVRHPLTQHLVRRLVWLAEAEGTTTAFRVAEDRTFADVGDDELVLAEGARVRLAHPLLLAGQVDGWAEVFADYEILQPFPQLGRAVFTPTEAEAGENRLARFEGCTVPVGRLLGLTKRGWERGQPQDAGIERWFSKRLGDDCYLVIALNDGIAVGMVDYFPDQTFETVWLAAAPDDYMPNHRSYTQRLGDLDPVTASELLADLTEVTAK